MAGAGRRWLRRIGAALLAAYAGYFAWTCAAIVAQSRHDEVQPADAIVVFGAAEYFGRPSPVYRARLDHAFDLYERKLAPVVITTGGSGGEPTFTEGQVGHD
jgi:vancomycin permeability regulator SanA